MAKNKKNKIKRNKQKNLKALRIKDVIEKVGLSRSSIYRLIKENKFPAPKKITERTSVWFEHDLDNFLLGK